VIIKRDYLVGGRRIDQGDFLPVWTAFAPKASSICGSIGVVNQDWLVIYRFTLTSLPERIPSGMVEDKTYDCRGLPDRDDDMTPV
jgi:hypothetical protein